MNLGPYIALFVGTKGLSFAPIPVPCLVVSDGFEPSDVRVSDESLSLLSTILLFGSGNGTRTRDL